MHLIRCEVSYRAVAEASFLLRPFLTSEHGGRVECPSISFRFPDQALCDEDLESLVNPQTQHLLTAAGGMPITKLPIHRLEQFIEIIGIFLEESRHQLF